MLVNYITEYEVEAPYFKLLLCTNMPCLCFVCSVVESGGIV